MIKQWHILGAGAIGRLFACKLSRMHLEPVLVTRSGTPGTLRQRVHSQAGDETFAIDRLSLPHLQNRAIQGLLVTTKANDAVDAVAGILPALAPGAPVILLHNGMGVLEALAQEYPGLALLAGTTTEGAYLDGEVLVHAGVGETVIGWQDHPAPGWFSVFVDSTERFTWTDDIDAALWRKLLVNCAINPLTAIHRCRNGALLDNPGLRAEVELLCEELAAVSAARGNDRGASCALDWALAVIQRTAGNQSSMLQDVLAGRETEVEYITGYLVKEARRLGVPCPHNEALLRQLDSASLSN